MVDPQTGAEHLLTARSLARDAAAAYTSGDRDSAAVLAGIGQIHATLAHTAALAMPAVIEACGTNSWETVEWARAIGFIRDHSDVTARVPGAASTPPAQRAGANAEEAR